MADSGRRRASAALARRTATAVAAIAVAVFPGCPRDEAPAPAQRPDVLLIVMDTTRADRCSFLGYGRPTTPRLEELAAESVSYANAWSPSSWTYPSHAAMFTGRTPSEIGIVNEPLRPLPKGATTLAEILSAEGWATGCFTGNAWVSETTGLVRGFQRVEPLYLRAEDPPARQTHLAALSWMRAQRKAGRPFLAYVNDMEPHRPRRPPDALERKFVAPDLAAADVAAARTLTIPKAMRYSMGVDPLPPALVRANSDLYDAEIAALDAEIGEFVRTLRTEGLLDSMVVVVTSDHGEGLGDHVWLEHGDLVHRELLHVPLLVRTPSREDAGTLVRDLVRLEDVFPTVLEACGVPVPEGTSGLSLRSNLAGRTATAVVFPIPDWIEKIMENVSPDAALRFRRFRSSATDGALQLIVEDGSPPVLYDLRSDPLGVRDLAAERPADVERLRRLLPPR